MWFPLSHSWSPSPLDTVIGLNMSTWLSGLQWEDLSILWRNTSGGSTCCSGSHLSCHTVSRTYAWVASVVSSSTDCIGCRDSLSMGFSRQECWSGLPGPPPGELLDPGFEPVCLMSPAWRMHSLPPGSPHRALVPRTKCSPPAFFRSATSDRGVLLPPWRGVSFVYVVTERSGAKCC